MGHDEGELMGISAVFTSYIAISLLTKSNKQCLNNFCSYLQMSQRSACRVS